MRFPRYLHLKNRLFIEFSSSIFFQSFAYCRECVYKSMMYFLPNGQTNKQDFSKIYFVVLLREHILFDH